MSAFDLNRTLAERLICPASNTYALGPMSPIVKFVSDSDKSVDCISTRVPSEALRLKRGVMSFGKRLDGPGGRRRAARIPTSLLAQLMTPTETVNVTLINMSSTGAKFHGPKVPPAGRLVLVRIDSLEAFGTVIWSIDEFCGVDFKRPADDDERQTLTDISNLPEGSPSGAGSGT